MVRVLVRRTLPVVYSITAFPSRCCGCAPTTPTNFRTTARAPPTSSSCSRGVGTNSKASRTAATTTSPSTPTTRGEKLEYFDQGTNERYVPHVIEPAAGATRAMMAFLLAAYHEERSTARFAPCCGSHHRLAPYKVAVLPLSKKDELLAPCEEILAMLAAALHGRLRQTQAIGKRYRRQDEIGTPCCVTVDFDTPRRPRGDRARRDTMEQDRVPIDGLQAALAERLRSDAAWARSRKLLPQLRPER